MERLPDKILFSKQKGSALILAVVLTTLLSIIGVTFVMVSRMNEAITSSIDNDQMFDSAVNSLINQISTELINDTPGVSGQEYYDYPGDKDRWLASIEADVEGDKPASDFENVYWSQISDPTGYLRDNEIATNHINIAPRFYYGNSTVIDEYPDLKIDDYGNLDKNDKCPDNQNSSLYEGQLADADGDGIADAKWIEVKNFRTADGQKIYAAIRVIDNCGMVNVNTALALDPQAERNKFVDGSSLTHIDLAGMIGRESGDTIYDVLNGKDNLEYRLDYLLMGKNDVLNVNGKFNGSKIEPLTNADDKPRWSIENTTYDLWGNIDWGDIQDIDDYFVWRYGDNSNLFQKFDISDEFALRERFCVNTNASSRLIELWPWRDSLDNPDLGPQTGPYDASSGSGLADWVRHMADIRRITEPQSGTSSDPYGSNEEPKFIDADKKHWLTTYSFDRMINPDGRKQFCINIDPTDKAEKLNQTDSSYHYEFDSRKTARILYYTFIKAVCDGTKTTDRKKLEYEEARQLGQLAANIVDLRDKDTDVTCLDLRIQNGQMPDEYEYLNPERWYNSSDDIDPYIDIEAIDYDSYKYGVSTNIPVSSVDYNSYCYGIELQPVVSGFAIGYDKYPGDPNDISDPELWKSQAPTAYYAVELYNPFDFDIQMRRRNEFYLVVHDRTRHSIHALSLNDKGIVEIPAHSFVIVCSDKAYWAGKIKNASDVDILEDPGLVLTSGRDEPDKEPGSTARLPLDNRIRISMEILLARQVQNIFNDKEYIYIDRQDISPAYAEWDPDKDTVKQGQRWTIKENSFRQDNSEWWDCLTPWMQRYEGANVLLGEEKDNNSIGRSDVDFSMPLKLYEETKYVHSPVDLLDYPGSEDDQLWFNKNRYSSNSDNEDWERDGEYSDSKKKRPIIEFATVGDISRVWTTSPKASYYVHNLMEHNDELYKYYLDETLADNVYDSGSYDPNDLVYNSAYDPNDPNIYYDSYTVGDVLDLVNATKVEKDFRINLRDPFFSNIFQYITVFDPSSDFIDNDGNGEEDPGYDVAADDWDFSTEDRSEWKIPGRINVNTAPWYVIAQLPWLKVDMDAQDNVPEFDSSDLDHEKQYKLARAITSYRDKTDSSVLPVGIVKYSGDHGRYDVLEKVFEDQSEDDLDEDDVREERGFSSIGELALVVNDENSEEDQSIDKLGRNGSDEKGYPDLITDNRYNATSKDDDGAKDDFEESDLIFSRISNLVTVRSDVFTAYLLVRLGETGPQKRVIAILDRSDVYPKYEDGGVKLDGQYTGKVKIVGLKQVGDIRY